MKRVNLELQGTHGFPPKVIRAYEVDPGLYAGRSSVYTKLWMLYHRSGFRAGTVGFSTRKSVIANYRYAVEQHGSVDWNRDLGALDILVIRKIVETMNQRTGGAV